MDTIDNKKIIAKNTDYYTIKEKVLSQEKVYLDKLAKKLQRKGQDFNVDLRYHINNVKTFEEEKQNFEMEKKLLQIEKQRFELEKENQNETKLEKTHFQFLQENAKQFSKLMKALGEEKISKRIDEQVAEGLKFSMDEFKNYLKNCTIQTKKLKEKRKDFLDMRDEYLAYLEQEELKLNEEKMQSHELREKCLRILEVIFVVCYFIMLEFFCFRRCTSSGAYLFQRTKFFCVISQ